MNMCDCSGWIRSNRSKWSLATSQSSVGSHGGKPQSCALSPTQAGALLRKMVLPEVLELRGQRRGARYVLHELGHHGSDDSQTSQ